MGKNTAKLRGVVKTYGKSHLAVRALDGINLDVMGATMTAIVGPSGSGKSTLLHVIGAMDKATEGAVEVAGVDLNALDQKGLAKVRREHIGFVFQTFNLIPILTALENVTLPMEFVRKGWREKKERGKYLLEKLHLDHRSRHKPSELSGGEQQRVAIARALANDPAIVLADEPTGNLDTKTGRMIYELLREIAEEKTVIVVTHDEHIAENADRVIQGLKTLLKEADIIANEASIDFIKSSLDIIGSTTLYSSFFFFIVGALLIIFIMMLVFRERQREVGILKALGASQSDIARQFILESIFLTFIGGVGSLAVSAVGLYFFSLTWTNISFQLVTTPLPFLTVLEMIIASVVLGTAGSIYPIIRSRRLSPVETLRME